MNIKLNTGSARIALNGPSIEQSSSQGVPANAVLYEDSSVAYHEDSSIVTYES